MLHMGYPSFSSLVNRQHMIFFLIWVLKWSLTKLLGKENQALLSLQSRFNQKQESILQKTFLNVYFLGCGHDQKQQQQFRTSRGKRSSFPKTSSQILITDMIYSNVLNCSPCLSL